MSTDVRVLLVDVGALGSVRLAIDSFIRNGDSSSVKPLIAKASRTIAIAHESIDRQIAEYLAQASMELIHGDLPAEVADEASGKVTTDPVLIRRHQAERTLSHLLVLYLWTVPFDGSTAAINLTRGNLADYLRSRSQWFDEAFSMSNDLLWKAETFTPSLGFGYDAWLLTPEEASRVLREIQSTEPPKHNARLLMEYDRVKHLFGLTLTRGDRRVLVTTS